jgi:hypothetical protein
MLQLLDVVVIITVEFITYISTNLTSLSLLSINSLFTYLTSLSLILLQLSHNNITVTVDPRRDHLLSESTTYVPSNCRRDGPVSGKAEVSLCSTGDQGKD